MLASADARVRAVDPALMLYEEVCVWIAVTYATAIVFEVVKVLLASERSVRDTLVGLSGLTNQ